MFSTSRIRTHRNVVEEQKPSRQSFFSQKVGNGIQTKRESPFFQPKLSIGKQGDMYERQADAVASAVVNQKHAAPVIQQNKISNIQLTSAQEERKVSSNDARMRKDKEIQAKPEMEKEEELLQKKSEGNSLASSSLSGRIENSSGRGRYLPAKTLNEMNSSFAADFSSVNIHTDAEAIQMNKELNAQAFTHGNDIFFNAGKYNTETSGGKQLLAHELTHVIQQSGSIQPRRIQRTIGEAHDLNSSILREDERLEAIFDGDRSNNLRFGSSGESVRRVQEGLMSLGFELETFGADGKFGNETTRAIKEFQFDHGLETDGIVGIDTITSLDDSLSESAIVEEEDSELGPAVDFGVVPEQTVEGTTPSGGTTSSGGTTFKIPKKKRKPKCLKIVSILVEFTKAIKDVAGRVIPIGKATATYDCGTSPLVISTVSGGSNAPSFGITDEVQPKLIFRIEDASFRNSKNQPMPFALFYHGGEAIHSGSLNKSSHGCVHVADGPKMKKMHDDSVKDKTSVRVKYDKGIKQKVISGVL